MDVLCFGVVVIDHRRAADETEAEAVALRLVAQAVNLHLGGIAILAVALRRLGLQVGLMGCVGRDLAGYGLRAYLSQEVGVGVEALRMINAPTSTSFIRLTAGQRYIEHTPGASAELLPGETELALVCARRPRLMAVGYAGLLPKLDADGGGEMAEWLAAVRRTGALVALDTHTVPPYAMLAKPVGFSDLFVCNREEAYGITGLAGRSPDEVVSAMWSRFPAHDPARPRLLGMALPEGVQFAYGQGKERSLAWIANPKYGSFTPRDLTGAGDCFRAGLYACVLAHQAQFSAGELDVEQAGRCGHLVAAHCLEHGVGSLPGLRDID